MKLQKLIIVFISIGFLLSIFWLAVSPLFHAGLFPTIDNIVVVRMEDMAKELSRGQFPVRYSADLAKERGYMLFNYYAPLPFYAGALTYKAGVNLVGALKRMYLVAFIIAAIGMYLFAKEYFGRIGGVVSAVFYIFSPYLGYDVYWRGGLGEVWAISFLPLTFWLYYKTLQSGNFTILSIASFTTSAIILSHNLTTYMIFPFLLFWIFYIWRSAKGKLIPAIVSLFLGIGISSFFWLPAFSEKLYAWVTYLQTSKSLFIKEFISSEWKSFFFPTFIPMMMNWVYLSIPFVSIVLVIILRKFPLQTVPVQTKKIVIICSIFAITGIYFATDLSKNIWNNFYDLFYIFQFPWRYWIVVTFFSSFLAGWIAIVLGGKARLRLFIVAGIMLIGIIWYSLPNFRPTKYEFVDKYRAEDPCGTSWGFEYLQVWVSSCIKQGAYLSEEIVGGNAKLSSIQRGTQSYSFISQGEESRVRIEKYFYPGWEAAIDGKKVIIEHDNPYGLIEIAIPKGKHSVSLNFKDTPLRLFSNILSALTVATAFLFFIIGVIKGRKQLVIKKSKIKEKKRVKLGP